MSPFILVFDVGTSSLKAVVFNSSGAIVTKTSKHYQFEAENEGWAEIDPKIWWNSLVTITRELLEDGIDLSQIKGIAFTGQMHSAVLMDRNDEIIAPSILWLDRRAIAETDELIKMFNVAPHKLNSSSTLPKLYWQSKYQPELLKKIDTILWPKDYLRYGLTGIKVTDYSEGIGSALMDWETKKWIPERIEVCGLKPEVLPEIRNQDEVFNISHDVANVLGFSPDCKVLVGMGDMAALLGGAPYEKGRLVYSMGSSSMYFTEVDFNPGDESGLYPLEIGGYELFGGISTTIGASLKWAHDQLWGGQKEIIFEDMIDKVLKLEQEDDPLLFFPFLAGERSPFWSDRISGSFEGLKLHHGRTHMTKAVMDGVAFSIRYILDLMKENNVEIQELALSGGGARTKGWPEIIATAVGKNVKIFNAEETVTMVLYAMMASVLSKESFRTILGDLFSEPEAVSPNPDKHKSYEKAYTKYKRFLDSKLGIYEQV